MKLRYLLVVLLFTFCTILSSFAEEDAPVKHKHLTYDSQYFADLMNDSNRIIGRNFRGDNKIDPKDLVVGAIANVKKAAEVSDDQWLKDLAAYLAENTVEGEEVLSLTEKVKALSIEGLDWQIVTDLMIEGMVFALRDDFSRYLTIEEYRKMTSSLAKGMKDYYGMIPGINKDRKLIIEHLRYASSSFCAGLVVGDEILAIDGKLLKEIKRAELVEYLSPSEARPLRLEIMRKGWEKSAEVVVPANSLGVPVVVGAVVKGKIGYVHPTIFSNDVAEKTLRCLNDMKGKVEAVILDLRNNPGGSAGGAVQLCDIFLKGRKIVTAFSIMKEEAGFNVPMIQEGVMTPYEDMPLVCLVNESSASASEMTSGALQDHNRATVLGMQTYGKGCAQAPLGIPASRGTRFLYLTMAKYYLPSGRTIHLQGVVPDIEVADGPEGFRTREFFMAMNSDEARKFAQNAVKKEIEEARKVVFSQSGADITALPRYKSTIKRVCKNIPGISEGRVHLVLKQAIFAAYASKSRDLPPFGVDDRGFAAALERLELEAGKRFSN